MDQNNLKPIGELFETIQFFSENDVNNLIDNLDEIQSFYFINLSLEIAKKNNLFSILELEIISKSLRKLKVLNKDINQNDSQD